MAEVLDSVASVQADSLEIAPVTPIGGAEVKGVDMSKPVDGGTMHRVMVEPR